MTVFITYRLADSLPQAVVESYRIERHLLDRQYRLTPHDPEIRRARARLFTQRIDKVLDSCVGSCCLKDKEKAALIMENLRHHDGKLYRLHSAVVMPNHVHVVATLGVKVSLARVTHAWKSFTGKELAKIGAETPVWQDECYDHIVRDTGEYSAYQRYVLENPAKAGLVDWPWVFEGVGWAEETEGGPAGGPPAPRGLD